MAINVMTICLPDFLQNHCNGEREVLLALPVHHGITVGEMHASLVEAYEQCEDTRLPTTQDFEQQVRSDIEALFSGMAEGAVLWHDPDLDVEQACPEDYEGEVYCYVRLNW